MTTSEQNKNSYQLNKNSDEQETNMAREKTSVERAISDLRRGALVMLFDPFRRTAAIIQAAELSTAKGLDLILKLAGSEPSVVITNRRSTAIRLNAKTTEVISVSIPPQGGVELVHRLANPIFENENGFGSIDQEELDNLPVVPEASDGLAPKAIQLVKFARLLPSVVLSRIPYAEMIRLSGWNKSDSLLAVDARLIDTLPEMRAQRLVRVVSAQVPLIDSEETNRKIKYTTLEAYPLKWDLLSKLNHNDLIFNGKYYDKYKKMHNYDWESFYELSPFFTIKKQNVKVQDVLFDNEFDVIYFDAFAPRVQPELWTKKIFNSMYKGLKPGGILVTYCAKGSVKRALKYVGFELQSIPGPPGKREMSRAIKSSS